jgi:hypothetical protein
MKALSSACPDDSQLGGPHELIPRGIGSAHQESVSCWPEAGVTTLVLAHPHEVTPDMPFTESDRLRMTHSGCHDYAYSRPRPWRLGGIGSPARRFGLALAFSGNSTSAAEQVKCQVTPEGAKSSCACPSSVIFGSEVMIVVPKP